MEFISIRYNISISLYIYDTKRNHRVGIGVWNGIMNGWPNIMVYMVLINFYFSSNISNKIILEHVTEIIPVYDKDYSFY